MLRNCAYIYAQLNYAYNPSNQFRVKLDEKNFLYS